MSALLIPSMAVLILLLNPYGFSCNAVNETASRWCDARQDKCLAGEHNTGSSEFLMDTEISRMLLEFQNFQTANTKTPNKPSVPDCNRPPRYDSCLGQKTQTPPGEKCTTYNRVPC